MTILSFKRKPSAARAINTTSKRLRKTVREVRVEAYSDVAPFMYWAEEDKAVRFLLHPGRVLMQGAFPLNSAMHPFVLALRRGQPALADFYSRFQPANLAEMYNLPPSAAGGNLEPWRLPWIGWHTPRPPSGEKGLDVSEGISFYGPATARKVQVEMQRLLTVMASVKTVGYQPDKFGDIEGNFLVRGDDFRFFVRGGKHRAAVLAVLRPWEAIPAQMLPSWPRMINRSDSVNWPLVRSGEIAQVTAERIFDRYFDA